MINKKQLKITKEWVKKNAMFVRISSLMFVQSCSVFTTLELWGWKWKRNVPNTAHSVKIKTLTDIIEWTNTIFGDRKRLMLCSFHNLVAFIGHYGVRKISRLQKDLSFPTKLSFRNKLCLKNEQKAEWCLGLKSPLYSQCQRERRFRKKRWETFIFPQSKSNLRSKKILEAERVPSLQGSLKSQWQNQRWVSGCPHLQTGLQLMGHQPGKTPGGLQWDHPLLSTIFSLHRPASQGLGYWLMLP